MTLTVCSALKGLVLGEGTPSEDPVQTVKDNYAKEGNKSGDEFLTPIIVGGDDRRIKGGSQQLHHHVCLVCMC